MQGLTSGNHLYDDADSSSLVFFRYLNVLRNEGRAESNNWELYDLDDSIHVPIFCCRHL